ncbi:Phosphatidyl-N-methylethanolamine N-methyltransferase [Symbiodinium microadriaticum]|uniref:phosphatidyl-N-methylethanolamine N-methyltransferase n=1 Tax=Symbiodinium microadriaticum TaxID=2951 RepID=A0A1Q9CTK7_SYMMI|nr:Phosphatidyl-N-methylethanolamine N-methyltransferase [Symbiodinium microadriaticum]CAE7033887.1 PLMT [Symbiodinium sp. KB8]CAE7234639.1 PLMT [Symbiodinium microadriaticum]
MHTSDGLEWNRRAAHGVLSAMEYDHFDTYAEVVSCPLSVIRGPGLALVGVGQLLNSATFKTIGAKGVYYGSQLGYDVPWATSFPYNIGISDPQYWGVICSVWGFYLCVAPSGDLLNQHFVVPWLETFWYFMSMKLLEHKGNGGRLLRALGFEAHRALRGEMSFPAYNRGGCGRVPLQNISDPDAAGWVTAMCHKMSGKDVQATVEYCDEILTIYCFI